LQASQPARAAWRPPRLLGSLLLLAFAAAVLALYARANDPAQPIRLTVYAFSTQEECYDQSLFPAFQAVWAETQDRDLQLEAVFGLGAPADVAILSDPQHVTWLRVARRLNANSEPVVVGYTPMVIVTRAGNPSAIHSFADLTQPGLRLLHADPRSSGAGSWSLFAVYGDVYTATGDRSAAADRLEAVWQNVRVLGASARATLTLFELGAGDALITYEQDALLAQQRGVALEVVLPPNTLLAQHVAIAVDDELTAAERRAADAFLSYLQSEDGQEALAACQLRPGAPPPLPGTFTVDALGGSAAAHRDILEAVWAARVEPALTLENGIRAVEP
jgi:sulfate/thiosulfate transport system substrate-binding protein